MVAHIIAMLLSGCKHPNMLCAFDKLPSPLNPHVFQTPWPPQVREIYESCIEAEPPNDLPDADLRDLCVRYAQLERKLGEIDRARAIFVHGSHLADPRRAK